MVCVDGWYRSLLSLRALPVSKNIASLKITATITQTSTRWQNEAEEFLVQKGCQEMCLSACGVW